MIRMTGFRERRWLGVRVAAKMDGRHASNAIHLTGELGLLATGRSLVAGGWWRMLGVRVHRR